MYIIRTNVYGYDIIKMCVCNFVLECVNVLVITVKPALRG